MNYLEAAIKILEEYGRPLGYKQIAAIALERDWIEPQKPDSGSVMNSPSVSISWIPSTEVT